MRPVKVLLLTVAASGILAACSGGPSEGQLFQACMKGGGMATEATCKCFARETKATLPPHVAQAMVLDMEGKKQEAAAILDKMSFEERANFGMKQFEVVGKCMAGK